MSVNITRQMVNRAIKKHDPNESDGFIRRLFRSAFRRWQRGRMIAALQAMDDRLLHDIGIHRADIPKIIDDVINREMRADLSARVDNERTARAATAGS